MIELYTWPTPNGQKVQILLEELCLPHRVHAVNIGAGDQFDPDFLVFSPNNKIPAIVDPDGPEGEPLTLFESGAILWYLADKHGRFLPPDQRARMEVLQWLMFQMGSLGPMLGQAHHFRIYAPQRIDYAVERYTREANRLYSVMDHRLAGSPWLGGGAYGIADIAAYPWTVGYERQGVRIEDYPHVQRWQSRIGERPQVAAGMTVLAEEGKRTSLTDEKARDVLFGESQYRRRVPGSRNDDTGAD